MTPIRGFGETRREPQELTAYAEGIGESWAGKLQLSRAKNPQDDKRDRLDGSYLALLHNNLVISLGYQDRWWGPGWQSALALSNNARPVPAISLQRKDPEPFETALLRWLGPWQFAVFAGQLEQDRAVPNAKLLGARLSFRPLRWAEFGLTRTAQWGGEGRPESWQSFQDLLLGDDNRRVNGNVTDDEPGNQLGGIDWRFSKTFSQLSLDFYGEIIGEDEAGGLPANVIGTFGLSAVVPLSSSELRVYLERTDTATRRLRGKAQYNKAYEHAIYQSGYRYYGRSLGASVDNDSRAHHLVAQWYPRFNQDIEIRLSQFDLNTDSVGDNSVSRGNSNDYAASVHYRYQSKSWSTRLGYYHYDGELSLRYADAGDDFAEIALEYHWKIYYADRNPGIFIRATISPQNRLCFYLRHHSNKNLVQV